MEVNERRMLILLMRDRGLTWAPEKAEHCVTSQEALWSTVKSCWDNMSHQVLHKLVESVPARVHAVIKEKGGHSKY